MKRFIKIWGLVLSFCLLAFISCSKQDEELSSKEIEGFETLKIQLLDLNNSLPVTNLTDDTKALKYTAEQRSEVMEIINIILDGYAIIDPISDDGSYSRNVSEAIDRSKIPNETKETLNNFSSVANASSRLWNTKSLTK